MVKTLREIRKGIRSIKLLKVMHKVGVNLLSPNICDLSLSYFCVGIGGALENVLRGRAETHGQGAGHVQQFPDNQLISFRVKPSHKIWGSYEKLGLPRWFAYIQVRLQMLAEPVP